MSTSETHEPTKMRQIAHSRYTNTRNHKSHWINSWECPVCKAQRRALANVMQGCVYICTGSVVRRVLWEEWRKEHSPEA